MELLDHHLVADARARRIEVDALFAGEGLDRAVLGQVFLAPVLDVVVQGEDGLARLVDPLRADGLELLHHGRGVVVRHHVARTHAEEITRAQGTPLGPLGHVRLRDLLDDGLTHDLGQ